MEGIRICRETGRSGPASVVYRSVSTEHRLANLVRRHGFSWRLPVDVSLYLETFAQRSRYVVVAREQSIPGQTAALRSRATLSLPFRAAWRERLVETRIN